MNDRSKKKNGGVDCSHYSFILFVIKDGENSKRAKRNLRELCEKWLPQHYSIEEVDVVDDFKKALEYNILITPSIVAEHQGTKYIIHGDLSDGKKFEKILNLTGDLNE